MDYDVLRRLLAALEANGVEYAIFGAVAMGVHGLARFTEDLDVFVAPTEANIERLKRALRSVIDDPEIDEISAADLLGDCPAVRYVPPEGDFYMDILTRLGEAFTFADLEIVRMPYDGLTVSTVTPRTLYRMKKDTVRPKDRVDADWLKRSFDLEGE